MKMSIFSSAMADANEVAVLPESRNTVVLGRTSLSALEAIRALASAFFSERVLSRPSVPMICSTDRAPPWMRTMRPSASSALRSVRRVISETLGNASLSWRNATVPMALTRSTMALRRSSMACIPSNTGDTPPS